MSTPNLQSTFSGEIPRYYDELLGPAYFGVHAVELARRLPADPGGDVLEIACGTGLVTRHLRERLDARRRLVATDLNAPMIEYARTRLSDLQGIEWRTADAAKLPFADGEFAAIACSFGVMFVPDRKALFSEARRVLKTGGLFLFNVWDRIEQNPVVHTYAQVIEGMFPGDKEFHFRAPYEMHDPELLRKLLDEGGFEIRTMETVRKPIEGVTPRDIATGQVRGTPRGLLLAKRGVEFEFAIDKVATGLEELGGEGRAFRSHCQAVVVEAAAR